MNRISNIAYNNIVTELTGVFDNDFVRERMRKLKPEIIKALNSGECYLMNPVYETEFIPADSLKFLHICIVKNIARAEIALYNGETFTKEFNT